MDYPRPSLHIPEIILPPNQPQVHTGNIFQHSDPTSNLDSGQDREELWNSLKQYYIENKETIKRLRDSDIEKPEGIQIHDAMDTFVSTANVVLEGLSSLANIHPVLNASISALHAVIKLDLARRNNNRTVLAVKLQMQIMMSSLFQLCELKHPGAQGDLSRVNLENLLADVAKEIKKCGSDLDYYSTRKRISKFFNATTYEKLFAGHIATFTRRRSELQTTISTYIARGVDAANVAICEVGDSVNDINQKIDAITVLLRRLYTLQEREALKFINDSGGPQNCIEKDNLLEVLRSKLEEPSESAQSLTLEDLRKELKTELEEFKDWKAVLSKHLDRFEKRLNVQYNNLKLGLEQISGHMVQQGVNMQDHGKKLDAIVGFLSMKVESGKLELKDAELQRIWERMDLKRSVKAKQFVLTFRDYWHVTDRSMPGTPLLSPATPVESSSYLFPRSRQNFPDGGQIKAEGETDLWALKYIDVTYVHQIVEAMDEDGSGFISIKEANKFACSRPKGLTLPEWIAYWAAGWHYTITDYHSKIYSIMLQMHNMASSVLQVNQPTLYRYLDSIPFFRLESILHSIRPLPDNAARDPQLATIADSVASSEEERLKINLNEMSFLIQSPADVALIAGRGRLEIRILPLLYLLLKRHMAIFEIARMRVLHEDELRVHSTSLWSIISSYDERMRSLKDIFSQMYYRDTRAQFENFAYGMFVGSFSWTGKVKPIENKLLDFQDISLEPPEAVSPSGSDNILALSPGSGLGEDDDSQVPSSPSGHLPHTMEGSWVGSLWVGLAPETGRLHDMLPPFQLTIRAVVKGEIVAVGQNFAGDLDITGSLDADGEHIHIESIDAVFDVTCSFTGTYDCEKDVIQGQWVTTSDEEPEKGYFCITRNSVNAFRFRYLLDDPDSERNPPWNIARKRWAFAIETVVFNIKEKRGRWPFFRDRIEERKKWIELSIRSISPQPFTSLDEIKCWCTLFQRLHPKVSALYETVTEFLNKRNWEESGVLCDTCGHKVIFRRYLCITCSEEDRSNQIDFCVDGDCASSLTIFNKRDFVHSFSHTLLRCTRRIVRYEKDRIISQSQKRSERIKRSFKEKEEKEDKENSSKDIGRKSAKNLVDQDIERGRPSPVSLICSFCRKELTLPCWACATCAKDTLICFECEAKGDSVTRKSEITDDLHTSDHDLLRIADSVEAKMVKLRSNGKEIEDLEAKINKRLGELEHTVDARLDAHLQAQENNIMALETKMSDRLQALEMKTSDQLKALETKTSDHFNALETKMEQLLSMMERVGAGRATDGQSPNV